MKKTIKQQASDWLKKTGITNPDSVKALRQKAGLILPDIVTPGDTEEIETAEMLLRLLAEAEKQLRKKED